MKRNNMNNMHSIDRPQDLVNDSAQITCASVVLFERFDEFLETQNPELFVSSFLGAVVLSSFAMELSLKAIHAQNNDGEFPRGHEISRLFESLPADTKEKIETKYLELTRQKLSDFLDAHNKSFQDWRYVAEQKSTDLKFEYVHAKKFLMILQGHLKNTG